MRPLLAIVLCLSLPALSVAQETSVPAQPSVVVFITSTSDLETDHRLLDTFQARWQEREPQAAILHLPLAPYAYTMTPKTRRLVLDSTVERLEGRTPTLILAQGDPAFFLSLQLREERYPGIPMIAFDVVGNEARRRQFEGDETLYIVENSGVGEKNTELAARIFPKRKRAVLLLHFVDDLELVKVLRKGFVDLQPDLDFVFVINPTSQDIADPFLRISPENTFVVSFNPGWYDKEGRYISGREYVRSIADTYNVPVFEYLRTNLDRGIVGGVGLSPTKWGIRAAEMALGLIFDGKEPEHWMSASRFVTPFVDYRELVRFGSSPKLLPPETELINAPVSPWIRYQKVLEPLLAILVVAVAVFAVRSVYKHREGKLLLEANARLEREVAERTRDLITSNNELAASNENLTKAIRKTEEMQENVLRAAREITLGRFAAGIANGLNSPLNAVRSANAALKTLSGGDEGGLMEILLKLSADQRSLFLRHAPRVLSGSEYALETRTAGLERLLADLSCGNPASVAADLADAGLGGLEGAELEPFSRAEGAAVAQALYRLSVLKRSSWIIDESVDRAAEVIRTIREYVASARAEEVQGPVDLRDTIEYALILFKNRLPRSVQLQTDYADSLKIRGSEQTFVRIWVHLLQNALLAMPQGGRLDISLRREGNFAVVSVEDEGVGVDPEIADRIFEPFVTTRPMAEGMGLGLPFCKRAVDALGGDIGFDRKDKGTVFRVRLPLEKRS